MPYDPATRILSVSFLRDPAEHADAMLEAGRRMFNYPDNEGRGWGIAIGTAIGFGAAVAVVMELYRRFLLPLVLAPADIAPIRIAALEMLPLILMMVALYYFIHVRRVRRQRHAVAARVRPGVYVDVDIFTGGVALSNDHITVEVDWASVRNVFAVPIGMEIEAETMTIYIPHRAFESRAAFNQAGKQIRDVWREAQKREHDSKLIAAGLD